VSSEQQEKEGGAVTRHRYRQSSKAHLAGHRSLLADLRCLHSTERLELRDRAHLKGDLMKLNALLGALVFVTGVLISPSGAAEKAADNRVVKDGQLVSLHYTLKGADGAVIESSNNREPLKYVHGRKMLIPGLEKELTGMKVGGEKHVTVKPEDGYGQVNKNAFQEIAKERVPPEGLKVGAILNGTGVQGQPMQARVHEIKEKTVVLDFNHPMAGKTLKFDVKVIDIQPAPPPAAAKPAAPKSPSKPESPQQPANPAEPQAKK
jgi:FKBP-type peptidyl-prolyl cis-trans isomerase SlyD